MEKIRLIDDAAVQKIVHLVVHALKRNPHRTQIGDQNTYELGAKNSLTHSVRVLRLLKLGVVCMFMCLVSVFLGWERHGPGRRGIWGGEGVVSVVVV